MKTIIALQKWNTGISINYSNIADNFATFEILLNLENYSIFGDFDKFLNFGFFYLSQICQKKI